MSDSWGQGAAEAGGGGRRIRPAADGLLCPPAVPLGTVVVPGDSDLELCRAHIERLQQVREGVRSPSRLCPAAAVSSLSQLPASASLSRSTKVLEPSPPPARNCPPSGASWTVSGPEGPAPGSPGLCPAPSLRAPGGQQKIWAWTRGSCPLSRLSAFPTATTASRFYRIDRAQVSTRGPPSIAGSEPPEGPLLVAHTSTDGLPRPQSSYCVAPAHLLGPQIGHGPALQTGTHAAQQ